MTQDGANGNQVQLRQQPFASSEKLRDIVADTYRQLKQRRADIQRKMALYLANKDTEFILFKPMKVTYLFARPLSVCFWVDWSTHQKLVLSHVAC